MATKSTKLQQRIIVVFLFENYIFKINISKKFLPSFRILEIDRWVYPSFETFKIFKYVCYIPLNIDKSGFATSKLLQLYLLVCILLYFQKK